MIDLEKLVNSARDKSRGKPLDTLKTLHAPGTAYPAGYMRNTRLHKNGERWEVRLHGNLIATIWNEPDGVAVMLDSVAEWPTQTTADRLRAILGIPVSRKGGRLRARLTNIRCGAETPPLVNGEVLRITASGVYCVNPEVVRERRTRVLKDRAAPVDAYLRKLRRLCVAVAKVAPPCYAELPRPAWGNLPRTIESDSTDIDVVMQLVAIGAQNLLGFYGYNNRVEAGCVLGTNECIRYFDKACRSYKDRLYSQACVYETYMHSYEKDFLEAS